jgi:hypothetical protein
VILLFQTHMCWDYRHLWLYPFSSLFLRPGWSTKSKEGHYRKRKITSNILGIHRCETPQQNTVKQYSVSYKMILHHDQMKFFLWDAKIIEPLQSNISHNTLTLWKTQYHYLNRYKNAFDKIQHPLMIMNS